MPPQPASRLAKPSKSLPRGQCRPKIVSGRMVVVIEIESHQELGSHLSPLKSGGPAVTPVCMKNFASN
jgi:hypothetical protein